MKTRKTDYRYLPNAILYYACHDCSYLTIWILGLVAGILLTIGVQI